MTDDVDDVGAEPQASQSRMPPSPRFRESGPPPMSRLERLGWAVLVSGVLVLVYFALTRST